MFTNKTVDLDLDVPEARRLADLHGISVDLEAVKKYCQRIAEGAKKKRPDFFVLEGLWLAAIVRYARCFTDNKPVRRPLGRKDLKDLSELLKGAHQFFIDLRNKHVAHSENPLEQNRIGVDLALGESVEPNIQGISLHNQSVSFLAPALVESLHDLSSAVLRRVNEQVEEARQRVLEIVKEKPLKEFYAKEHWEVIFPTLQDVRARRSTQTTSSPTDRADG
jgi:hypothetical protein